MLIQFSLTNYRNFKDTATLDLSEAKITEFPEQLYCDTDGMRIIPMAALYGANGCGKTTLLKIICGRSALQVGCNVEFSSSKSGGIINPLSSQLHKSVEA